MLIAALGDAGVPGRREEEGGRGNPANLDWKMRKKYSKDHNSAEYERFVSSSNICNIVYVDKSYTLMLKLHTEGYRNQFVATSIFIYNLMFQISIDLHAIP